ncbi:MAG: hypothetical protein KGD64_00805 [Candidatus Heimdallarchaeota archaeon]|nr:hypothetical protein [Candidatus Heimdallarchaeota archaeon]
MKGYGVDVLACAAGSTATPNYIATKPNDPGFLVPKPMKPEKVAKSALKKLGREPSMVPSIVN